METQLPRLFCFLRCVSERLPHPTPASASPSSPPPHSPPPAPPPGQEDVSSGVTLSATVMSKLIGCHGNIRHSPQKGNWGEVAHLLLNGCVSACYRNRFFFLHHHRFGALLYLATKTLLAVRKLVFTRSVRDFQPHVPTRRHWLIAFFHISLR